jgi:pilus assembly protein CpaC
VSTTGHVFRITVIGAGIWLLAARPVHADDPVTPAQQAAATQPADTVSRTATPGVVGKLTVTVGKSLTIDSPLAIKRLSTANGNLVEAVAIGPKEVLINGKAPGETSLIIWQENDTRLIYDLTVRISPARLNAVREQLARDFPDSDLNVTFDNDTPFVRGTVKDLTAADRVVAIVSTLGRPVNLLHVDIPAEEPQILLKVRFADVDRKASLDLSASFASGAFNQNTALGGGSILGTQGAVAGTISSVVNIFALRKDINLMTAIQALEGKNLLEILAEPNVVAINGKAASFTAGGEFPFPMVQPGSGTTSVTVAFKEYGVKLNFLPQITPRGTIRLQVTPEVSSLDYSHSVTMQGFVIPGMAVRRVDTEIELESGQSFVIAGLIDKQITDAFSKVPGLSSIPILGKLFQTKSVQKDASELLIIITPELVRPIPATQAPPELKYSLPFLPDNSPIPIRHPSIDVTGPVPVHPPNPSMPVEQLQQMQKPAQATPLQATPTQPGGQAPAQTPPVGQNPPAGAGQVPPANPGGATANPNKGGGNG